jgi:hypothetical protein
MPDAVPANPPMHVEPLTVRLTPSSSLALFTCPRGQVWFSPDPTPQTCDRCDSGELTFEPRVLVVRDGACSVTGYPVPARGVSVAGVRVRVTRPGCCRSWLERDRRRTLTQITPRDPALGRFE